MVVIGFDLSPQSCDREVDRPRAEIGVEISPHGPKQFAAPYDHIAMFGQVAQQLEFAMREWNRPSSSRRVLVQKIDRHFSQSDPADARPRPAEHSPHPRE